MKLAGLFATLFLSLNHQRVLANDYGPAYVGCYMDDPKDPAMTITASGKHGVTSCRQHCANENWAYAGVTAWTCYCGNSYDKWGAAADDVAECDLACRMEPGKICGGFERLSVYGSKDAETPEPTPDPTPLPTAAPTAEPSPSPTSSPTAEPSPSPTSSPTAEPSPSPTSSPTPAPTGAPTAPPTKAPTGSPTSSPTDAPTASPTDAPTASTTDTTESSTKAPTTGPSTSPTSSPTEGPTDLPTASPTDSPTTLAPTGSSPTTGSPTAVPTSSPSAVPTASPTSSPTKTPTASPTEAPTSSPTASPSPEPTEETTGESSSMALEGLNAYSTTIPAFYIQQDMVGLTNNNVFIDSKKRWQQIIKGGLGTWTGSLPANNNCKTNGQWPNSIDNVYICSIQKYIDGPGGILGYAGPRYIRGTGLTLVGEMVFESGYNPSFGTIVHEMGHVLGLGTLWQYHGLAQYNKPCPYKKWSSASWHYRKISQCTGAAPTEQNTGRQGSDCGHWAENCMASERMTFNGGGKISRITVGSLRDIGYTVKFKHADKLTWNQLGSGCRCGTNPNRRGLRGGNSTLEELEDEVEETPRRQLSKEGMARAEEFGRGLLMARQVTSYAADASGGRHGDEYIDFGSHMVMVLYEEDGEIHDVTVRA